MKLTIEQKAKAYDEALKVLHKYDGANHHKTGGYSYDIT